MEDEPESESSLATYSDKSQPGILKIEQCPDKLRRSRKVLVTFIL